MPPTKLKVVVLGESGVGKTCLLNRFVDKKYNATEATIQLDLRYAVEKVNGVEYKVELWDTVGAERFRSITANYFRNAQGAILVYDITDPKSLNKLEFWLNDLYDKCDNPNIAFIVVGNKIDQERAISRKEGEDFANKHGGLFIETSAKCDQFVEDAFHNIVKKIVTSKYFAIDQDSKTVINQNNINIHIVNNSHNSSEQTNSAFDHFKLSGSPNCCQ